MKTLWIYISLFKKKCLYHFLNTFAFNDSKIAYGDPPPPHNVERFECLEKAEKRYINVMNYY